jgi:hypothetical protein
MTDTYSQIAGSLGLPQNATKDLFALQEKNVTDSVRRTLQELRSTGTETLAGRGMGLSTFGTQAMQKKEADVESSVLGNLAQQQTGWLQDLYGKKYQSELNINEIGETARLKQNLNEDEYNRTLMENIASGGFDFLKTVNWSDAAGAAGGITGLGFLKDFSSWLRSFGKDTSNNGVSGGAVSQLSL